MKRALVSLLSAIFVLLLLSAHLSAAPSANIVYNETSLGGGLWQYDYTFFNTSTNNEYLYSVYFDLAQEAVIDWLNIPTGWYSTTAGHTPVSSIFLDTWSNSPAYDIAAGSSLGLFSFTIDYKAEDIAYTAYLDDHQGGINISSGITTMVPEPVSSILFLFGGLPFFLKRYFKRKN